jgi:hypothetical protein
MYGWRIRIYIYLLISEWLDLCARGLSLLLNDKAEECYAIHRPLMRHGLEFRGLNCQEFDI